MHRSGTSALTHALVEMGAFAGSPESLMPSAPDNPEGFFEAQEFSFVNMTLLKLRQTEWFDPPRLGLGPYTRPGLFPLQQRARFFLDGLAGDALAAGKKITVIKDPRACISFPFWAPLLKNPVVILCLRAPSAVARSLQKRNNLLEPYGRWLYAWYLSRALDAAEDGISAVVFYEELISNPLEALAPVAGALGIEAVLKDKDTRARLQKLVRPEMNHGADGDMHAFDSAYESLRKGPRDLKSFLPKFRAALEPVLATHAESLPQPLRIGINRLIGRKGGARLASD